jgi:hypothetical protein
LTEARRLAGKLMVQVAEGRDPAAERKADRGSGTTFEELAKRYRTHAMKKNKSWQQADALVTRFLVPPWAKLQPGHITRADVKSLMAQITAPMVCNQTLAAASAIFGWAVREELVKVNPCVGVERNKTTSRERVLSATEVPKFWQAFDSAGLIASMALKMILLTGQRPGEVSSRTAGGRCPANPCLRWAGPAPRAPPPTASRQIPSNANAGNKNIPTLAKRCIRHSVANPIRKTSWRSIPMLKNRHHLSSDMVRRRSPIMSRRWLSGIVSNSCIKVGEDEVTADD